VRSFSLLSLEQTRSYESVEKRVSSRGPQFEGRRGERFRGCDEDFSRWSMSTGSKRTRVTFAETAVAVAGMAMMIAIGVYRLGPFCNVGIRKSVRTESRGME